ncbi:MAG: PHB depolymerase family esterase [Flavobacteriales bacterium]
MRSSFALVLVFIALVSCKRSKFESDYLKFKHDGETRTYLLHIPKTYSESVTTSLVIALHGGTGSAKNIESQSGLPELSDEKGFILCSPNGLNRTWNAGWCCGKASKNDVDDVGFISVLINHLLSNYNIDSRRIYVTGMSNGAMMSYRLACELDNIAAIAPVAGTMVTDCAPSSNFSIIHFHSKKDRNVPVDGGIGSGISDHYNPALDSVRQFWASHLRCMNDSTSATDGFDFWSNSNCADSSEIQFYITNDGGHSWPGGTQPRKKADTPSTVIDANELMWEFFKSHPRRN